MSQLTMRRRSISLRLDGIQRNVLLDTGGFWSLIDPSIAWGYRHHRSSLVEDGSACRAFR